MSDQRSAPPAERGAQNERTSLAWTRTGLALLVAAIVTWRFAATPVGPLAVAGAVAVAGVSLGVLVLARRRYRATQAAVRTGRPGPDGLLPALVATAVFLLAVLEVGYVLRN